MAEPQANTQPHEGRRDDSATRQPGDDEYDGYDPLMPAAVGASSVAAMVAAMKIDDDRAVNEKEIEGLDANEAPPPAPPAQTSAATVNAHQFFAGAIGTPQSAFGSQPPSMGLRPTDTTATHDENGDELPPPPDMAAGDAPLTDLEKSNLYVSNISTEIDDDGLKALFAPFGAILNSRIMVDIHTCKSRGFGFVQFSKPAEAARAVRAMDGSVHFSQTLMVRLASRRTRQPGTLTSKMFLRNVPAGVSEDELRRICTRFGPVTTCAVRPDVQHGIVTDGATGGISQVAYITFTDVETTKRAAASLNNSRPWESCVHPLLAKVLDSNQKRRDKGDEAQGTPGLRSTDGRNSAAPSAPASAPPSLGLYPTQGPAPQTQAPQAGAQPPAPAPVPGVMPGHVQYPPVYPQYAPVPHGYVPSPYAYPGYAMPQGTPQQPAAGQSPGGPMMGPSPVPSPYAYGAPGIPPGYQIVMQPTLQPVYGPPPGMTQQPHPQPQQYYSPNAFGNGTPQTSPGLQPS